MKPFTPAKQLACWEHITVLPATAWTSSFVCSSCAEIQKRAFPCPGRGIWAELIEARSFSLHVFRCRWKSIATCGLVDWSWRELYTANRRCEHHSFWTEARTLDSDGRNIRSIISNFPVSSACSWKAAVMAVLKHLLWNFFRYFLHLTLQVFFCFVLQLKLCRFPCIQVPYIYFLIFNFVTLLWVWFCKLNPSASKHWENKVTG